MTLALTRFAPSPTGLLHLGHVYAADQVWRRARELGASVLLRIEDTDFTRCRPDFDAAILDDLAWLGFDWTGPVVRQSTRKPLYAAAIERLKAAGLLYPCRCTRREIEAAWQGKPEYGPEGLRYPGTCKGLSQSQSESENQNQNQSLGDQPVAWRLDMAKALAGVSALETPMLDGSSLDFLPLARATGDVVLVRKDIGSSYHLAVTVDDALQQVTHVIRGEDMREATAVHRVLQQVLDYPVPVYDFHALILEDEGRKLSKRDGSEGLRVLRAQGLSAAEVLALARQRASATAGASARASAAAGVTTVTGEGGDRV
jgi:glutamyl-Q tRNA(Asp) synthetase